MDAAAAEQKFGPELRIHGYAAEHPDEACKRLDFWVGLRVSAGNDNHAVSAGLVADPEPVEAGGPDRDDIHGDISRTNLKRFLDWVSHYVGDTFGETDLEIIELGLAEIGGKDPDGWYICPFAGPAESLHIGLASALGGDLVSIRVRGATSPPIRLRIDTLLDAL